MCLTGHQHLFLLRVLSTTKAEYAECEQQGRHDRAKASPWKDETISRNYWGKKIFLPQILTVFRLKDHRKMGLSRSAPPPQIS